MSHIDELRQMIDGLTANALAAYLNPTDAILAATYPPACQNCHGKDIDPEWKRLCCPTIAELWEQHMAALAKCAEVGQTFEQIVAWGLAVATAERYQPETTGPASIRPNGGSGSWYVYADSLLDAIRAVKP